MLIDFHSITNIDLITLFFSEPTCKLDKYSKEIISNEDTFQKEFALSSGTTKIWFKCKDGTIFHVCKYLEFDTISKTF